MHIRCILTFKTRTTLSGKWPTSSINNRLVKICKYKFKFEFKSCFSCPGAMVQTDTHFSHSEVKCQNLPDEVLCACRRRRCATRSSWWRTCWPASARTSSLWLSWRHGHSPRASTRCAWRSTYPTRTLRSALVVVGANGPDVSVQFTFDASLVPRAV